MIVSVHCISYSQFSLGTIYLILKFTFKMIFDRTMYDERTRLRDRPDPQKKDHARILFLFFLRNAKETLKSETLHELFAISYFLHNIL